MSATFRSFAAAAVLALYAGSALAKPPPKPVIDDPEAAVVESLTVSAKLPGPAWWRVSDGDTTVYVLGLPDALPKGAKWDQSVLKRRLKGANTLITAPVLRAKAKPTAIPGAILSLRKSAKSKESLDSALPPPLRARFASAAVAAGHKPGEYKSLRPWFAGIKLTQDFRRHAGLDFGQPHRAVINAAKGAKVKAVPAMTVDTSLSALLGTFRTIPQASGVDCLEGAVDEIEAGAAGVRRAGQAWATGDVRGALAAPRSYERCWAAIPGAAKIKRDAFKGEADAIERALGKPGHAVAALPIRALVAQGGVLEQLRARGYTVTAPE